jgi:hypothetical protein
LVIEPTKMGYGRMIVMLDFGLIVKKTGLENKSVSKSFKQKNLKKRMEIGNVLL